jgi:branched-chain amino acid transport system ATP-binding protein
VAEPVLSVKGLSKRFGGLIANDRIDLEVGTGEIHAVIGPNGAGKSTLIAAIAGELRPDAGHIVFAGREVSRLPAHARALAGLARSFQITSVLKSFTVLENVALAVQAHAGHSFRFWRPAAGNEAILAPARAALGEVGLGARGKVLAQQLSHGEQRQLEIAMALAARPKLLLLDEPMAGQGPDETRHTIEILMRLRGRIAILLVEHDMDAVFALADRVTVLAEGAVLASGTPDSVRADQRVRAVYLGS